MALPRGSIVVPVWGAYLESYKIIPKKELLWSLWVGLKIQPFGSGAFGLCLWSATLGLAV